MSTGSGHYLGWKLPEKLQIVKPIEGSQTLHQWSQLAQPTFGGLLEERPGVKIRGGKELEEMGKKLYPQLFQMHCFLIILYKHPFV